MESSTEILRRMLDERGVEYRFNDATKVFEWHFYGTDGEGSAHATEVDGGINIIACSLTPEQAIAATLGNEGVGRSNDGVAELEAGTCHMEFVAIDAAVGYPNLFLCSECEQFAWVKAPNTLCYCPNCGAKVVGAEVDDG